MNKNVQYVHVNTLFPSVSKQSIRYPLSKADGIRQREYLTGRQYPDELIPKYIASKVCDHGCKYSEQAIVAKKKSYIHLKCITMDVKVCYRPSVGECLCRQEYEGAEDLLFNYNNVHIFAYSWLIDILHEIIEAKKPLAACIRAANRSRTFYREPRHQSKMYHNLRCAYNAFIRRLDVLDNVNSFRCSQCPVSGPDTLQMDGTAIGCKKDKMAVNAEITNDSDAIPECRIVYRVLFRERVRKKLAIYVGKEEDYLPMENNQYQMLIAELPLSFSNLLEEAGPICPEAFQNLLRELSTPYSTCAIFRLGGNDARTAREILEEIGREDFSRVETHCE